MVWSARTGLGISRVEKEKESPGCLVSVVHRVSLHVDAISCRPCVIIVVVDGSDYDGSGCTLKFRALTTESSVNDYTLRLTLLQ
jgi:hypothetical protein